MIARRVAWIDGLRVYDDPLADPAAAVALPFSARSVFAPERAAHKFVMTNNSQDRTRSYADQQRIALDLMREHGLIAQGWTLRFTGAESRMGSCSYGPKHINLSRGYATRSTDEEYREVVLHEIAHALAGREAHHGPAWRAKAREIGCTGRRTIPNPYSKKTAARPSQRPAYTPTTLIPNGTPVAFRNRDMTGIVLSWGKTRYKIAASDGRTWAASPGAIRVLEGDAAAAARAAAAVAPTGSSRPGLLPVNTRIQTSDSRVGVIFNVTAQNYHVRIDGGRAYRYPHASVTALPEGAEPTRPAAPTFVVRHPLRARVRISNGVVGTIVKVNPKRYVVLSDAGVEWSVPHSLLTVLDESAAAA